MKPLKEYYRNRKTYSSYLQWMKEYSKPYVGKITIVMIFSLVTSLISVLMAVVSKRIIDSATQSNGIIVLVAVYALLMLLTEAIGIVQSLMSIMLNEKFSFGIRKQIYDKIIRSEWMDVTKYHTGDLMTRLTSDAGNISDGIVSTIPDIIRLLIELVVVFFTLFIYSKLLAVFALVLAPIAVILCLILGKKLKKLQVKVQETESKYRSFLQESLANLMVIKAFTNEEESMNKLVRLRDDRFYWVFRKSKMGMVTSTMMSLTFQIGYIVAFTYGAFQISNHAITYGTMTIFLTLVNRVQAPIIQLAQEVPRVVSIFASAGRIIELQNIPLEEKKEQQITTDGIGITAKHLSFGYNKDLVLNDASMEIYPEEFVAIVGESGIGKTTLIRLLMSFLKGNKGNVEYWTNTGEREEVNATNREFISYVPQGNTLFSGTIRENLLTGKSDATQQELEDALVRASAFEFVKELPNGLDTVIGERGHGLSEGQAQRIAIARALVRKAPVLILDEATSALDEKTELSVLQQIHELEPKPTCILITHRRSVLEYCDRELIIEDKKIILRKQRRLNHVAYDA